MSAPRYFRLRESRDYSATRILRRTSGSDMRRELTRDEIAKCHELLGPFGGPNSGRYVLDGVPDTVRCFRDYLTTVTLYELLRAWGFSPSLRESGELNFYPPPGWHPDRTEPFLPSA